MKAFRETQKRVDSFATRWRENEEHFSESGSMATALLVSVKAVNGRGRTKKVGGTF